MSFVESFKSFAETEALRKETENGAMAYASTKSKVLDLFAVVGALRTRTEEDILEMFDASFKEDKKLTAAMTVYSRDIRNGGCGERRTGRIMLKQLADEWPELVCDNLGVFADAGRYDDLFVLFGTKCEQPMLRFIAERLRDDAKTVAAGGHPSLLAKWMPSINASSKETRKLALRFCRNLDLQIPKYRRLLSYLRKAIGIVESKMSAGEWTDIDFNKVPSYAMKNYSDAFFKHDPDRWTEYLQILMSGKSTIHSGVLFPYDIIQGIVSRHDPILLDAQWKGLPDYFNGVSRNVLALVDTSGSMLGNRADCPLNSAIGLGIYCAEHNQGDFHNILMTFSRDPKLHELEDSMTIVEKYKAVATGDCANTNLDKAFAKVFEISKAAKEAPEALLILSDMEIDSYFTGNYYYNDEDTVASVTNKWKPKFSNENLKFPKIIFWNLEARQNTYLATPNEEGVSYISGVSAGLFTHLDDTLFLEKYPAMVNILTKYAEMLKYPD